MANLLGKGTNASPAAEDFIYAVDDPSGTPADTKVTLGNAITKAHGLSDEVIKVSGGVMTPATAGTDYYKPGGTDVAIADGGTGQSTKTLGFDALSPLSTQGDILYHDGTNNVRLPKGNAAEVLRMNGAGTIPEWAAGAGGGQTLYDTVVAASGGDYTTLQDALDAASSGETIFVRSGTYALAANKTYANTLNNITIIGENPETAILDLVSYTLLFQGTNINFQNMGVTVTTGKIETTGVENSVVNCHIVGTSATTTPIIENTGASSRYSNNIFEATAAVTTFISNAGYYTVINGNAFKSTSGHTSTTSGFVYNTGLSVSISSNSFTAAPSGTGEYAFVYNSGTLSQIASNVFYPSVGYRMTAIISGQSCNVTGNFIYDCYDAIKVTASSTCQIVGNFIGEVGTGRNPIYCSASNTDIVGNTITNPKTTGIQIRLVGADRVNVTGNSVLGGDTGVAADVNSTQTNVSGNTINVNNTNGTGVTLNGDYAAVTNNYFYITTGTNSTYGVYTNNTSINISNNTFRGSSNFGQAIYANSSSNLITINSNNITGCYAGIIVNGGDGHIITSNLMATIGNGGSLTTTGEKMTILNNIISDAEDTYAEVQERKVLRLKNTSGGALAAGDIVVRKAVAAGNEITTTTTGGDPQVIGMALEAIADTALGYVLIKGKTAQLKVDGTNDIAIGDFISTFTTAKIGKKATTGETAIAIALEAFSTDSSTGVIDALLISPRVV